MKFNLSHLAVILIISIAAFGNIRLPGIIGDNMVLQQGAEVPIWGWAEPNEKINVLVAEQNITTICGNNGKWMVKLKPLAAGKPLEMTIKGNNTILLHNILVGEVWLASGQSNMYFPMLDLVNPKEEIAKANKPQLRLFSVKLAASPEPLSDCEGKWLVCTSETVANFSAIAYFFGANLNKELQTPIGLIQTAWGGTAIESWTSQTALKQSTHAQEIYSRWEKTLKQYPAAKQKYDKALADWQIEIAKPENKGKRIKKPKLPPGPDSPHRPSSLFNAMISPLLPYGIKGVIWYQGEQNAIRAIQYRTLFPEMIADWRKHRELGDFPFLYVQLANYNYPGKQLAWAELREAQMLTLSVPNTAMVTAIDIGDANNIHPKNKQEVARRLALAALTKVYGQKHEYYGPIYKSMEIQGDKVLIEFDHAKDGFVVKGEQIESFEVAGNDRKFLPAKATIEGSKIVVSSADVKSPIAVRYAWDNNPKVNLYNKSNLPVFPFRTDDK